MSKIAAPASVHRLVTGDYVVTGVGESGHPLHAPSKVMRIRRDDLGGAVYKHERPWVLEINNVAYCRYKRLRDARYEASRVEINQ